MKLKLVLHDTLRRPMTEKEFGMMAPTWKKVIGDYGRVFDLVVPDASQNPTIVSAEKLIEAAGNPSLKASQATLPVFLYPKQSARWSRLQVTTWSPNLIVGVMDRSDATVQVGEMVKRFEQAIAADSDIFVAPEAYFFKTSKETGKVQVPFSAAEKALTEQILQTVLKSRPGMLVVAGTMIWIDDAKNVHNQLMVFCGERNMSPSTAVYDKNAWTGEEKAHAKLFGAASIGGETSLTFLFKELRCGVQICQDSANEVPVAQGKCGIHIVCGWNTGHLKFKTKPGGLGVYADANGTSRIEDEYTPKAGEVSRVELVTKPVHVALGDL